MARLVNGMPVGKLGNVIFSSRNGKPYLRSMPRKVRQPKTAAQKAHWTAFGLLAKLSSEMCEAHEIGFANMAKMEKKNSHSLFRHFNKGNVSADGIDYPQLVLSLGRVPLVQVDSMLIDKKGVLTLTFSNDPKPVRCGNNAVILFAYCPDRHEHLIDDSARRHDGTLTVTLPKKWKGMEYHLYLFLRDAHGKTSPSLYLEQKENLY